MTTQDKALEDRIRIGSLLMSANGTGRTDPRDLLATARADYATLTGLLYAEGYYGGTVNITIDGREAATLSPLDAPGRIGRIAVTVNPGPQFRFSQAAIAPLAPDTALPEGYRVQAPALSGLLGEAARAGISGWRAQGHAKADLADQSITANHGDSTIAARLSLTPGPKLRFGSPEIAGQRRMRVDRIAEIAGLPVGETFSPAALEKSAQRLRRTGVFRSVSITEGKTVQGEVLPIGIDVVEEKRRRLGFGVEVSSNEGLTLSSYWIHRNLLGGAERLRVDAEVAQIGGASGVNGSGIDGSLSFRLERPATFTPDTDLFVAGGVERVDDPGYLARSATLAAGLTHRFSDTITLEGGLAFEASNITDASGNRDFRILSMPLSATRDTRDAALDATQGSYLSLGIKPFAAISGTESGAQLTLDARGYRSFGERVTLAGRAQLGAVWGPSLAMAPPDMLFFAGGGGTVRGLSYQELGVPAGVTLIGGRSFVGLSAEVRTKVTDTIGVVGFVDTAYIGAESFYDGSGNWGTGGGLGLRYLTPIGPVRLDVAVPLDAGPTDAKGVQIYIGIGQSF